MQHQLSPEKYIKTKARTLPIHECLINEDWQESKLASIFISRRQPSGNFIVGLYLIDLKCLGVKDTFYFFNQTSFKYDELVERQKESYEVIKCAYDLAHNIIFAGLEFALEYDILPEKGFGTTKYILEDDEDESVPLMDIECGQDGMPHLFLMYDQVQKYNNVLVKLRHYPGDGNFLYTIESEDDYDFADHDIDRDNEPLPDNFFEKVESGEASIMDESPHAVMDLLYRKKHPDYLVDIDSADDYIDSLDITYDPLDDNAAMSEFEKTKIEELYYLSSENPQKALPILIDLNAKFPYNKVFANYLFITFSGCGQDDKAIALLKQNYKDFKGYIFAHINYALYLVQHENYEEAEEVMGSPASLLDFISGRPVHFAEALSFFFFWGIYYLSRNDISKGELYYRMVWRIAPENSKTETLRKMLTKAKSEAILT